MHCAAKKKAKDAQAPPELVPAEVFSPVHAWDGSIQQLVSLSEQVCPLPVVCSTVPARMITITPQWIHTACFEVAVTGIEPSFDRM